MIPPRIVDPHAVPVLGADAHLPPVPAPRLQAEALRRRFQARTDWPPEINGDGAVIAAAGGTTANRAAVLVPLVVRPQGLQVLLTQRSAHLRGHAGQVSFPGGRAEPGESDPAQTALREAHEEVGLPRERVEVIGRMPVYTTVTNYAVTPVVALVRPPFELQLDRFEVAAAFEVPLDFLMDPAHHRRHVFLYAGAQRQFLSMPWQGATDDGQPCEFFIWGATAAMLRNLYRFLSD